MKNFAAIDFETANNERTSVCSVGIVIYRNGKETDRFPFPALLHRAEPVIEYVDGWNCDISGIRCFEDLPQAAQNYADRIETAIGCPITYISVGAERDSIILKQKETGR